MLGDLFATPGALPALVLVPLLWLLLWARDQRRARLLRGLLGSRAPLLAGQLNQRARLLHRWLASLGLLAALVSLLQPLGPPVDLRQEQRGLDILICLDVSRSMLARDLAPSRLARARAAIRQLLAQVRADRVALIAFAGSAFLASPFTTDMDSLGQIVMQMDPLAVKRGGTDLGATLDKALQVIPQGSGKHTVVLLLSDGEDQERRGLQAARRCHSRGIRVHCVGFGSTLGGKIPLTGEAGQSFLLDRSGREVVTALNPEGLRRMAEATGGTYLDAASTKEPLVQLHEQQILPQARTSFLAARRRTRPNHFQWPLLAAFFLWLVDLALKEGKKP